MSNITEDPHSNSSELENLEDEEFENLIEFLKSVYLQFISHSVIVITSLAALIAGAISWARLTKWRTFKNYVFLNAILAVFIHNFFGIIYAIRIVGVFEDTESLSEEFYFFSTLPYNSWILITNMMFYSDIVKIYDPPITRRYLKAFLAGWVAPATLIVVILILETRLLTNEDDIPVMLIAISLSVCMIIFINFILYLRVIWSLMRSSSVRRSKNYVCTKIQIATLLFVISGVGSLALGYANQFNDTTNVFQIMTENITFIPSLAISLCLFVSKSNRMIWTEYYGARFRKNTDTSISIC